MKRRCFFWVVALFVATIAFVGCEMEDPQAPRMEQVEVELTDRAGEAVDLGLSVLWADDNVAGRFAWGEVESKSYFSELGYQYCENGTYIEIGKNITGSKYDAARMLWGGKWRMPTEKEFLELLDKCDTEDNGRGSIKVTGPNGNYIYFKEEKMITGNSGYWTATQFGSNAGFSWAAAMSWNCFTQGIAKYNGLLIRPVMDRE